jgi:sugar lactone lactonase YvrE
MNRFCNFLTTTLLSVCTMGATTIATYPPGTILENIAIGPGGDLFVTDLGSGTIFQISPAGSSRVFGQVPVQSAGIAFNTDGTLVAVGETSFYRFALDGTASLVMDIAGAGFLNGVTVFSPGVFLVADDSADLIWQVDLSTGSARPWLTNTLLIPPPGGLPFGPNGIKLFGGAAYITNTGAGTILRVPILPDGSAGAPEVYASSFPSLDDFAFGSDGSIFAATQIGEIIRLHPDGSRTTLATGTLGDAALAFGRTAADSQDIYIVNNGGAFLGLPGGPEAASVVRLSTDTKGVVPEQQVVPEPATLWLTGAGTGLALLLLKFRTRRALRRNVF